MGIIKGADIQRPQEPAVKSHDLKIIHQHGTSADLWARGILDRLKEVYEAGEMYCICECYDSTIVKEGGEIWQNMDLIKILDNRDYCWLGMEKCVVYRTDFCPICGKPLPTVDGGRYSNGMKVI